MVKSLTSPNSIVLAKKEAGPDDPASRIKIVKLLKFF